MKKFNLLAVFALLAMIFSSCSKEPMESESPYRVYKSFYFIMEMGSSRPTSYGFEDLNNKTKWGPAMSVLQDYNPAYPLTTIKVNNKFGIPVEMQGDLLFNFVLSKKGTDPTGKYDAMLVNGDSTANIIDKTTEKSYNIHRDSLKFNITVIGKSILFGKYAEGNFSMNLVDVKDTSKLIPIKGGFRLHMAE